VEFEYDPAKSAKNLAKHGIDFEQAQRMWDDVVLEFDADPRSDDARYLELGVIDGKHWTAIVTYRGEHKDIVRIISVRHSRDYEEDTYEQHKDD
jgi:uncharacterized DUF497 family protein